MLCSQLAATIARLFVPSTIGRLRNGPSGYVTGRIRAELIHTNFSPSSSPGNDAVLGAVPRDPTVVSPSGSVSYDVGEAFPWMVYFFDGATYRNQSIMWIRF